MLDYIRLCWFWWLEICRSVVTIYSPYKIMTILLTMFLMLYITTLWLIYFIIGSLYLFIPYTYFIPPLPFSGSHCLFSEVANLNEAGLPLIQFCHTVSSPHSEIIKQSLSFVVLLPLCSLSRDHQDSSYSQLSYWFIFLTAFFKNCM